MQRISVVSTVAPLDFARGKLRAERRDLRSTISGLLWREGPSTRPFGPWSGRREFATCDSPGSWREVGEAGCPVAGAELARFGWPRLAGGDRNAAARQERAERNRIDQVGRHALDRREAARALGRSLAVDPGRRAHQAECVTMARAVEELA